MGKAGLEGGREFRCASPSLSFLEECTVKAINAFIQTSSTGQILHDGYCRAQADGGVAALARGTGNKG